MTTNNSKLTSDNTTLRNENSALQEDNAKLENEKSSLEAEKTNLNNEIEKLTTQRNTTGVVGYEYVDLGLPSGVLWATTNVGASKPEDKGDYFSWGETQPKEGYYSTNYKYGSQYRVSKYCTETTWGTVDHRVDLEKLDDAARMNWGGKWMIPSELHFKELAKECYLEWTEDYNGTSVSGLIVYKAKSEDDKGNKNLKMDKYSVNDIHIFFPLPAYNEDDYIKDTSNLYHTRSTDYISTLAKTMTVNQYGIDQIIGAPRYEGCLVRPVCDISE